MTAWTSEELSKIAAAEELKLASARHGGTLRRPVTIWVVRDGDDLYVRSWRGRTSSWFRSVQDRYGGHIRAGGVDAAAPSSKPTMTSMSTLPSRARATVPSQRLLQEDNSQYIEYVRRNGSSRSAPDPSEWLPVGKMISPCLSFDQVRA